MPPWQYVETQDFIDSANELDLSKKVRDAIKQWATTVFRTPSKKNRLCFRTPNNKFELWNAKLPNEDANRGVSGGFRLTYFFNLLDNSICLGLMELRKDLGGKEERPRDQQKYNEYIEAQRVYLTKLENELSES